MGAITQEAVLVEHQVILVEERRRSLVVKYGLFGAKTQDQEKEEVRAINQEGFLVERVVPGMVEAHQAMTGGRTLSVKVALARIRALGSSLNVAVTKTVQIVRIDYEKEVWRSGARSVRLGQMERSLSAILGTCCSREGFFRQINVCGWWVELIIDVCFLCRAIA